MTRSSKSGMGWRRLAEHSRWFFILAVALAAVAVVLDRWNGPSWALMALGLIAAGGVVALERVRSAATRRDRQASVVLDATRTAHWGGALEKVSQVPAERMGVHPSRIEVKYLRRDAEVELVRLLSEGKPALVIGDSMVGKTRMSAQVLRKHFPDHDLVRPSVPNGLAALMAGDARPRRGTVVWLDDLDRYLTDDGFRVEWLDRMLDAGALVLATIRASEHARHRVTGEVRPPHAELLERFNGVRLRSDEKERERLATDILNPALREGVLRYGLGSYLGGGPLVVQRFDDADVPTPHGHPLGVAIVRAAADWRRIGLDTIPLAVLSSLAHAYLPERDRHDLGEGTEEALRWATDSIEATISLLEHSDGRQTVRATDYIVDHLTAGGTGAAVVPDFTWRTAVTEAPTERHLSLSWAAYNSGRFDDAETLWRRAAASVNLFTALTAKLLLGNLLHQQNQLEEAQVLWRDVAASSNPEVAPMAAFTLGNSLYGQDQRDEAEFFLRQATASNHVAGPAAAFVLGTLLYEQGHLDQAEIFWRQAITAVDPFTAPMAAFKLGNLLCDQNRLDDAELFWRQAATSSDSDIAPLAAFNLGVMFQKRDRLDDAEPLWRQAANSNHPEVAHLAAFNLGNLLCEWGWINQAIPFLRQAADSNDPEVAPSAASTLEGLPRQ